MGNLFVKKARSYDSIVLDELNRPLIPDVQHNIFSRLTALEKEVSDIKDQQSETSERMEILNKTISHKNVSTGNDIYKINEALHQVDLAIRDILADLDRLVKNDSILKKEIEDMNSRTTIQGLYTSETSGL